MFTFTTAKWGWVQLCFCCILLLQTTIANTLPTAGCCIAPNVGEMLKNQTPNVYLISIGISLYNEEKKLHYAADDARRITAVFRDSLGLHERFIYTFYNDPAGIAENDTVTLTNIMLAMNEIAAKVKANDRVYFYFAGHGGSEIKGSRKSGQLLLSQSPINNYDAIKNGVLPIVYLEQFAKKITQKNAVLVVMTDACFAGLMSDSKLNAPFVKEQLQQDLSGKNIGLLMSCQAGEHSHECGIIKSGIYTTNLILLILGKTTHELLEKNVFSLSAGKQSPCITGLSPEEAFYNLPNIINAGNVAEQAPVITPEEQALYSHFTAALDQNQLLNPEQESAFYFAKQLQDQYSHSPLTIRATAKLANALLKQPQDLIKRYVDENVYVNYGFATPFGANEEEFIASYNKMAAVLSLLPPDILHYGQLKAQKLWFEFMVAKPNSYSLFYANRPLLEKAIALDSTAVLAYHRLGFGILRAHYAINPELKSSALPYLNIVAALAPNWSHSYNGLGLYNLETKNYADALKHYDKGIVINRNNHFIYGNRAYVYYRLRQYDSAIKEWNEQVRVIKKKGITLSAQDLFELSIEYFNCYMQLGDTIKAKEYLQKMERLINKPETELNQTYKNSLVICRAFFDMATHNSQAALEAMRTFYQNLDPSSRSNYPLVYFDPVVFTYYTLLRNNEEFIKIVNQYCPNAHK